MHSKQPISHNQLLRMNLAIEKMRNYSTEYFPSYNTAQIHYMTNTLHDIIDKVATASYCMNKLIYYITSSIKQMQALQIRMY